MASSSVKLDCTPKGVVGLCLDFLEDGTGRALLFLILTTMGWRVVLVTMPEKNSVVPKKPYFFPNWLEKELLMMIEMAPGQEEVPHLLLFWMQG